MKLKIKSITRAIAATVAMPFVALYFILAFCWLHFCIRKLIPVLILLGSMLAAFGQTLTWFTYSGYANGAPQTNPVTFTPYYNPSAQPGPVVVNGTNIYSDNVFTFTPNAAGFFLTNITANAYRVTIPALGVVFYANIPNLAAPTNSLSVYVTNQPVSTGFTTGFQIVTNMLGYQPGTNGVPLLTTSNPTNSFTINTPYTAPPFKTLLTGFSLGGVLHYTNINIPYQVTVTNNFAIMLSTNATWDFEGVNLTNCTDWQNP